MSFRASTWALTCPTKLSATARLVLALIGQYANRDGRAYPSHATLQAAANVTWRTLQRALSDLLQAQCLMDTGDRVGRQKNVHVYLLSVPSGYLELASFDGEGSRHTEREPLQNSSCSKAAATPVKRQGEPITQPKSPKTANAVFAPHRSDAHQGKGTRIPKDWEPPEPAILPLDLTDVFERAGPDYYQVQGEAFRDYWLAEAGRKARKCNWDKAWFCWLRRQPVRSRPRQCGEIIAKAEFGAHTQGESLEAPPAPKASQRESQESQALVAAVRTQTVVSPIWLGRARVDLLPISDDQWGVEVIVLPRDRSQAEEAENIIKHSARAIGLNVNWVRYETYDPRARRSAANSRENQARG